MAFLTLNFFLQSSLSHQSEIVKWKFEAIIKVDNFVALFFFQNFSKKANFNERFVAPCFGNLGPQCSTKVLCHSHACTRTHTRIKHSHLHAPTPTHIQPHTHLHSLTHTHSRQLTLAHTHLRTRSSSHTQAPHK